MKKQLMPNCIWCGGEVNSSATEITPIFFKKWLFQTCSHVCHERASSYLVQNGKAVKITAWLIIPAIVLYGAISTTLIFQEVIPLHRIDYHQAILLFGVGLFILFFPLIPNHKQPIPSEWRNMRTMIKVRIAFGILFFLMAALQYFWQA